MANVVAHAAPQRRQFASLMASVAMVAGVGMGPLLAGVIAHYCPNPIHTVFRIEIVILSLALIALFCQKNLKLGVGAFLPRIPTVPQKNIEVVILGVAFFGPGLTSTSFILSLGPKLIESILRANNSLIAGCMAFSMFSVAVAVQFLARRVSNHQVFATSGLSTACSMLCVWLALVGEPPLWLVAFALLAGAVRG